MQWNRTQLACTPQKSMFFELILKTVEKKKLGQSYRFRSDPSNGDLDKGRKKNVISGTTE